MTDLNEYKLWMALLATAADSVDDMSDEEIQAELNEQDQTVGPTVGEIIAASFRKE